MLLKTLKCCLIAECRSDEFDCEDLTCIPIELKCNDIENCRYRGDEDKEEVCIVSTVYSF